MRLAVSEQGYASGAEALVSGNELAARAATRLAHRLHGCAGMAGDDSTATDFARSYDDAAAVSVAALASVVGALGALGRLVEASLTNHTHAESRSALPGWARTVTGPPTVADRAVGVRLAAPPSALGAHDHGPGGAAGLVLDLLHDVFWPNADTDRVRAAGDTWGAAATQVALLGAHCDSALTALEGERSPEIPLALATIRDLRDHTDRLATQYDDLATACHDYATHVETKRHELVSLLDELVKEFAVGALVSGVISFASGGAATGLATTAGAARIASASTKAREILASLRVLAAGTAFETRTVTVTAGEIGARAKRVSEARTMLMEGRTAGAAVSKTAFESPTLWAGRQTAAGGHMEERHVGKSLRYLRRRLLDNPDMDAASTFPDAPTAHRAVHDAVTRRGKDIDSWLGGRARTFTFEEPLGNVVGHSLFRSGRIVDVEGILVRLIRDPSQPEGFYVRTAFPKDVIP